MFKELFTEAKETYWIVDQDTNMSVYGPFDETTENEVKDRFMKLIWRGTIRGSGKTKLIKTTDSYPRDTRGYIFKNVTDIMTNNFRLTHAERERLGL